MAKKLSYQITRTPDDGYRVYLGGNQYVQRATNLAIQKVIREHKMTLANRGRKLAAVPSDLVAALMTLHHRCEAAGTTVADAVDFWLPYYAKKIASIPMSDAIDHHRSLPIPRQGHLDGEGARVSAWTLEMGTRGYSRGDGV